MNAISKLPIVKTICIGCGRFHPCNEAGLCFWCGNKAKLGKQARSRRRSSDPFAMGDCISYVSLRQLHADTLRLVGLLPHDIVGIVGVARSGMAVASMVAMLMHKPLFAIRQTRNDIVACGNGWRLGGNQHVDVPPGRVAVIDDTVMTGNSLIAIRNLVQKSFPKYVTAVTYVNPNSRVKPDIWARDLAWPHLLEWNMFNSILSPNMALDFDGILCRDCLPGEDDDGSRYLNFINTANPRYLPRRTPVPLIVTARIEKYRDPTMAWLRRHGINCHRLVMHPAKTLRERNQDDIAVYKARHYTAWNNKHRPSPPPNLFIESDDNQAKRIAAVSGAITVCPGSEKVYWGARVQ